MSATDGGGSLSCGSLAAEQKGLRIVPSRFLLLVVRPGASSSVLAPRSHALVPSSFLLLVRFPEDVCSCLSMLISCLSTCFVRLSLLCSDIAKKRY